MDSSEGEEAGEDEETIIEMVSRDAFSYGKEVRYE